jgi:glutathione synthase/RimK-type ligase-like ATP-grasp enzyme
MSFLKVRSRHPSHNCFRKSVPLRRKAVIRLGSTSESNIRYEINSIEAVKNSSSKLLMKTCFSKLGVLTPNWNFFERKLNVAGNFIRIGNTALAFPIVAKYIYGSRGNGLYLINCSEDFTNFAKNRDLSRYIFEEYYSFSREYRVHVSRLGVFYSCRKLLKNNTPEDKRWFRNDSNCNWITENNAKFKKPDIWPLIEKECVLALKAVQLDIGACDVIYDRKTNLFSIVEINSAPSMGAITEIKYREQFPLILKDKYKIDF